MKKPDFFIVGAPKCGTTAMNHYLGQHPEIFIPDLKELHFFGSDLKFNRHRPNREEYLALFQEAGREKRVGEASVWYLYSKEAAEEIKEFCPTADIIIMLRNPVDMLYSLHSQMLYTGNEDIADFEVALEAEEDRKQGLRIPSTALFVPGLFYRETVEYSRQVERYLNVFGREHVHVIIFDDFRKYADDLLKKTFQFLGVNPDFQPDLRIVNANKQIRSRKLQRFLNSPPQVTRRFGRAFATTKVRQRILKGLKSYNTNYESRYSMDPQLRRRLQAEFAPEVEELSRLLDLDLRYWLKD